MPTPTPGSATTLFFLCDLQTKFRPAIYGFDQVVVTANKLLKLAKILGCEVVCTTQNAKALGPIDPAIDLESLGPLHLGSFDKTSFSMLIPEVQAILDSRPNIGSIVLFGIESHICVLQTALSLLSLSRGSYIPYVIADGISSANAFEIPIALARLRHEGAVVTTSESLGFQLLGTAAHPSFKQFSRLVKEEKEGTSRAGEFLLLGHPGTTSLAKEKL